MTPFVSTVEIARPPEEVFAYATDPSRFSEWQKGVVSGAVEGAHPQAVGSRCTRTRRFGGGERTTTQEVTEISLRRAGEPAVSTDRSGRTSACRSIRLPTARRRV